MFEMYKQYSIVVPAVISAVVQALCTFALEKLANVGILWAAAIASVPSLIVLVTLVFWLYARKQQSFGLLSGLPRASPLLVQVPHDSEPDGDQLGTVSITKESVVNEALFNALSQIGLVEISGKLSNSPFTPDACIRRSTRSLSFLGVLGSKWVNDPAVRAQFSAFLGSIEAKNGHVQFCLINPWGSAYKKLYGFRSGNINWESLRHYRDLKARYGCLEVKLYDALPKFRLIFIDEKLCVIARYKIDERGYYTSRYGWAAPHLSFLAEADWSFYDPFSAYFGEFWSKAKSIDRFREQLDER